MNAHEIQQNNFYNVILRILFFFATVYLCVLPFDPNPVIRVCLYAFIMGEAVMAVFLLKNNCVPFGQKAAAFFYAVYILLIYFVNEVILNFSINTNSLFNTLIFALLPMMLLVAKNCRLSLKTKKTVFIFNDVVLLVYLFYSTRSFAYTLNGVAYPYLTAGLSNPNQLGMIMFMCLAVFLLRLTYSKKYRLIYLLFIAIDLYLLYCSRTRTGLFLAIFLILLYFILKRHKLWNGLIYISVLVPALYLIIYMGLYDHIKNITILGKPIISGREDVYARFLGYITGATKFLFGNFHATLLENAHNIFLTSYSSFGIFAAIFFIVFLCKYAKDKNTHFSSFTTRFSVAVFCCMFIYCSQESYFLLGTVAPTCYLMLLGSANAAPIKKAAKSPAQLASVSFLSPDNGFSGTPNGFGGKVGNAVGSAGLVMNSVANSIADSVGSAINSVAGSVGSAINSVGGSSSGAIAVGNLGSAFSAPVNKQPDAPEVKQVQKGLIKGNVVKNASWIIICKVIQSLLGLAVTMLSARYLGPSGYGLINYAISIASFVLPVTYLGFNSTLVQEIVNNPDGEGKTLGSALLSSFVMSFISIGGILAFVAVANRGETDTLIVCALYGISLVFQTLELIQYWFQAKLLSKYTSLVMLVAYVVVSAFKISLLATGRNIYWFAVSYALDYAIISISLIVIYNKKATQKISFSFKRVKEMFSKSRYYIVSNMMIVIFAQTDKIMIKIMIDDAATGYYSAGVALAAMTGFVFSAIIDSFRPVIFEQKKLNEETYRKRMIQLYSVIIYVSLIQCVGITALAKLIVRIIYGAEYGPTVPVLRLIVWYTTFSYLGSVRNIWMLAENKQKYLWIINTSGALLNVILNYFLITTMGIMGAALASLITQIFTNVIIGFIIRPIAYNNVLMMKSLNPKTMGIKEILAKRKK